MAYASLVSLAQVLEQILHYNQDSNNQVTSLKQHIVFLVGFLDEFPQGAGALLEGRISYAATQAQDTIEFQISDELHSDYRCWGVLYCIRQVLQSVFSPHRIGGGAGLELRDWRKLHKTLQSVMKEVETIVEEVKQIKSTSEIKDPTFIPSEPRTFLAGSSSSGPASKDKGTTDAIGLEEDLTKIKERLCGVSSKREIIPIIGMGGIGKTTLARTAYNDSLSVHRFDVRGWVTVSQDHSAEKILLGILHSMNVPKKHHDNETPLDRLFKFLKGRRYLIVMDDMWMWVHGML